MIFWRVEGTLWKFGKVGQCFYMWIHVLLIYYPPTVLIGIVHQLLRNVEMHQQKYKRRDYESENVL